MSSDLVNLFSLWEYKSKNGVVYLSGYLGDSKVVAFRNTKKTNDKAPDWRVMVSKGKRQLEAEGGGSSQNDAPPQGDYGDTPF